MKAYKTPPEWGFEEYIIIDAEIGTALKTIANCNWDDPANAEQLIEQVEIIEMDGKYYAVDDSGRRAEIQNPVSVSDGLITILSDWEE